MSNVIELDQTEIRARFEGLFEQIVRDEVNCGEWQQADVVFRNGQFSQSFQDVELLMASHHNGSSLLYSSQGQGSNVYSVIGNGAKVSFTYRT
jgi:3'-phosphoadenosine 5'-phosphosulfate sulfotransferase